MVRVKNRYIVVQIVPEVEAGKITFNDSVLTKCVMKNVGKYYGEFGVGSTEYGFRVKYCNDKTRIAIIR
uniref:Ribonuclease P/MRP protein subunit POP5 n=1 Tax=Megaselia scalaris TaxID=36166 RepID=T1H3P5_MEGSC